MVNAGSVIAYFGADTSDFTKKLAGVNSAITGLSKPLGTAINATRDLANAFALTATVAGGALIYGLKGATDEYNKQQETMTTLTTLILNQKKATMANVDAIVAQAKALQMVTPYSDDVILSSAKMFATFEFGSDTITKIMPSFLDMISAEKGMSLNADEAAQMANGMGKAMQGNTELFTKMGFQITDAQKELLKFGDEQTRVKTITEILGGTYKGNALALRNTFGGQMQSAMNTLSNFQGLIGEFIAKAGYPLIKSFNDWAVSMGGADGIFNGIKASITQFLTDNAPLIETFKNAFVAFGQWTIDNKEILVTSIISLAEALGTLVVIGTIANFLVMMTNPLTILIALLTALYFAWNTNFLGIRDITFAVVEQLKQFWTDHKDQFIAVWEIVKSATKAVVDVLIGFWNDHKEQFNTIWEGVKKIISFFIAATMLFWKTYGQNIIDYLRATWQIVSGIFEFALDWIIGIISMFIALVTGDWEGFLQSFAQFTQDGVDNVGRIFGGLADLILIALGSASTKLTAWLKGMLTAVQEWANKVTETIAKAFDVNKRNSPSIMDRLGMLNQAIDNSLAKIEIPKFSADIAGQLGMAGTTNKSVTQNVNVSMGSVFDIDALSSMLAYGSRKI